MAPGRRPDPQGRSHYLAQLKELSLDAAGVAALVRDYLPVIEAFEPAYVEEMRGIAEGAGVPFEDVVLLNARTEILKLGRAPELRARLRRRRRSRRLHRRGRAAARRRATAASSTPRTGTGRRECAETAVVLKVRRDDGPDLMTFTEAGALGALRLQRRRHRHHRELSGIRSRLPAGRRAAGADPPQGAGAASMSRCAMRAVYCTRNPPPTT